MTDSTADVCPGCGANWLWHLSGCPYAMGMATASGWVPVATATNAPCPKCGCENGLHYTHCSQAGQQMIEAISTSQRVTQLEAALADVLARLQSLEKNMSEFDWTKCKTNRRGDKVLWAHEIRINYLIYGFLVESSGLLDYMTVEKHTGLCHGNGNDGYDLVMPNRRYILDDPERRLALVIRLQRAIESGFAFNDEFSADDGQHCAFRDTLAYLREGTET